MQKASKFGLVIASAAVVSGFMILAYVCYPGQTYFGYRGYCDEVRLEYEMETIAAEVAGMVIFAIFYIVQECLGFVCARKRFLTIGLVVATNSSLITYKIVQYPIFLRVYGFLSANGQNHVRNPMLYVAIPWFALFFVWSRRSLSDTGRHREARWIYLLMALLLGAIIVVSATATASECMG